MKNGPWVILIAAAAILGSAITLMVVPPVDAHVSGGARQRPVYIEKAMALDIMDPNNTFSGNWDKYDAFGNIRESLIALKESVNSLEARIAKLEERPEITWDYGSEGFDLSNLYQNMDEFRLPGDGLMFYDGTIVLDE